MVNEEAVVEVCNVTRRFREKTAIDNVSLSVPVGCVFGLIGENGAGKTTIIKHILGLLKPQKGTVRVFGLDPVSDPVGVLGRIGYFSEESDLPVWMKVHELMRYAQAFYPGWDEDYADGLRCSFALETEMVIKDMSRGQKARAGLLLAMSYRPDLLVLDEPSSGLDPIVRRDILTAIVRTIADEGRTVLFSSHLLAEVERVADYVAVVRDGKIVLNNSLGAIKDEHFRATLRFTQSVSSVPELNGVLKWDGSGREWNVTCNSDFAELALQASRIGAVVVDHGQASLDDIFFALSSSMESHK